MSSLASQNPTWSLARIIWLVKGNWEMCASNALHTVRHKGKDSDHLERTVVNLLDNLVRRRDFSPFETVNFQFLYKCGYCYPSYFYFVILWNSFCLSLVEKCLIGAQCLQLSRKMSPAKMMGLLYWRRIGRALLLLPPAVRTPDTHREVSPWGIWKGSFKRSPLEELKLDSLLIWKLPHFIL